ncbi:MAG: histidinol-phosphate transaminase [Lachnospiraceae bacterium]|nr:histidinol-phosphate transaminase [Lachnospiraceae bacterium]
MRYFEQHIRRVTPYTPGEQPKETDIIKLNTNENPYPPAPGVRKALQEMDYDLLRRYPDPAGEPLRSAIARELHLKKEEVFVGVGSDDVLAMLFLTFFNGDRPILFPDITYSFYDVWAEMLRIPYETKPLDQNFTIRKEDYFGENGGIVIANPNAPTGTALDLSALREIIERNRESIVIVDEAYIDFGGESVVPWIREYDNLLVTQTFSKSRSLAGMRIGEALGCETLIRYLNDVKYSFNSYTMNTTAILAGAAALSDRAYFEETRQKIIETRIWTAEKLRELGFAFSDSVTNFLFVTHPVVDCEALYVALREQKIYVRHFSKPARIAPYLRITIGTKEEMEALLGAIREYMKKEGAL